MIRLIFEDFERKGTRPIGLQDKRVSDGLPSFGAATIILHFYYS